MIHSHSRSPRRWLAALLWRSYWGLATVCVVLSVPLVALFLHLDDIGASDWVKSWGWPFSFGAGAAQELASGLVTTYAALVSVYFSISLLVLTLAASNLGVRLVDRWIFRRTTRVTLAALLSGLTWALIALLAIDSDADRAARLTLVTLLVASVALLCWLSFALHDLGRTIHVDTAITAIGRDAVEDASPYDPISDSDPAPDWATGTLVRAHRDGYVEAIALDRLGRQAMAVGGWIRIEAELGAYVMTGDRLATVMGGGDRDHGEMAEQFAIGKFRSATQGAPFYVRLLVEIAARALSPAVNDFYTGRACVDALGPAMIAHADLRQEAQWLAGPDGAARVLIQPGRFAAIFDAPLHALRKAAADYPAITTRLLEIYGRVLARDTQPAVAALIRHHRAVLLDHAVAMAQTDEDRDAIRAAAQP